MCGSYTKYLIDSFVMLGIPVEEDDGKGEAESDARHQSRDARDMAALTRVNPGRQSVGRLAGRIHAAQTDGSTHCYQ